MSSQVQGPGTGRKTRRRFQLSPSFNNGLFGGLLGGFVAGFLILLLQFSNYPETDLFSAFAIVIAIALTGAIVSAAIQMGIARARQKKWRWNSEVAGGTAGGALGGMPVGAYLGWYFGAKPTPAVESGLMIGGTVITVITLALAVLLYGRRAYFLQILRGLAVSTTVVGLTAVPLFDTLERVQLVNRLFNDHHLLTGEPIPFAALRHAAGGLLLGAILGGMAGLQIGLTFWIVRKWDEVASLEPSRRRRPAQLSKGISAAFLWCIAGVCLVGGVVRAADQQFDAITLAYIGVAASLATAGKLRFKLKHKDVEVEVGADEESAPRGEDPSGSEAPEDSPSRHAALPK